MAAYKKLISDESGQSLVEYSLILSIVTLVAVGSVILFGESILDLYQTIKEDVINAL